MLGDALHAISLAKLVSAAEAGRFRAGQEFRVVALETSQGLEARIAGQRIPLDSFPQVRAGDALRIQVLAGDGGPRLQVQVAAEASAGAPATPGQGLASMVARALGLLGRASETSTLLRVLPQGMPANEQTVQQYLQLFLARGQLGRQLGELQNILTQATAAGAFRQESLQHFASLLAPYNEGTAEVFRTFLERMHQDGRNEARLAKGQLQQRDLPAMLGQARGGLRSLIQQWLQDNSLQSFLRSRGLGRAFEQAAENVLQRLDAGQAQQLHGRAMPYAYWELPMPPGGPIHDAHIHLFGEEGEGGKRGFKKNRAAVALDLATAHLGELWITLNTTPGGHCHCRFAAASAEAGAWIDEHKGELETALSSAGFPHAWVEVTHWDGNRLERLAALFPAPSGLNMEG